MTLPRHSDSSAGGSPSPNASHARQARDDVAQPVDAAPLLIDHEERRLAARAT